MTKRSPQHAWIRSCLALSLGLAACDPGGTPAPVVDPGDTGSDEDVGAGDLGPTPVDQHGQLRLDGTRLVDASGAPVQLKGVSSMWLNWETDGYAENATALGWMRNNWHLSVVRASMGVEPQGAYLTDPDRSEAQVEQIVQNAIDAGVYVIIDWHDHHATMHEAQAAGFFSRMAKKYGDRPNVLYETFNEPLALDWDKELKPYHQAVVQAIRAADPDNLIILGTPSWSQDVDVAAGAPLQGDGLMYTLHFYSCSHKAPLRAKGDAALAKGLPLFVTEWGATAADGGLDGKVCLDEASTWHAWMDARGIGWAAWKLDNCAVDSTCLLAPGAPLSGGWTHQYLHGHGPFVRARMQEP
jgi:endoglucanase